MRGRWSVERKKITKRLFYKLASKLDQENNSVSQQVSAKQVKKIPRGQHQSQVKHCS